MTTATVNNGEAQFNGFLYTLPTHDVPRLRASAGVSQDIHGDRYTFNIDTDESTPVVEDAENRLQGVL